jgi:hypothetical protein
LCGYADGAGARGDVRFAPSRCRGCRGEILPGAAILLIGGDKTGDKRFYERMIPVADRL